MPGSLLGVEGGEGGYKIFTQRSATPRSSPPPDPPLFCSAAQLIFASLSNCPSDAHQH